MNTLQNIYNKLADKTELESHKVELANINEFIAKTNDAKNRLKQFNEFYAQLDKLIAPIIKSGQLYVLALNDTMDLNNELAKQFQDLGLNWTTTPEAKAFKDLRTVGERSIIDSMVAKVKNL